MLPETRRIVAYVAPFAVWIGLQTLLPTTAWAYAVRSVATLVALVGCRRLLGGTLWTTPPVGEATPGRALSLGMGLLGGLLVLALWIAPESLDCYRRWCCWPLGSLPGPTTTPSPYEPAVCGWPLTIAKLLGSAFVIAPVEELFFRSFLYRWLQRRDFLAVPLRHFDLSAFLWMVFLFTLEHDRPLAAAVAGAIYGLLAIRFGLGAAIVAHVVTNLLLAVYVILWQQWAFW